MTRAVACLALVLTAAAAAIGCGASALSVMSDSIDAARLGLKATCTAETIPCEVKRMRFNDWTAAYDAALAAQHTPRADELEAAAASAGAKYVATLGGAP